MNELAVHAMYSAGRLLAGIGLALVTGTALGLSCYYSIPRKILRPVSYLLAPVPKVALLPVFMLFFGIGDTAKIAIIFAVMLFQVVLAMSGAVSRIPHEYYIPLKAAGAKTSFIIRRVVFPACLPELLTAVRVGLATGISALFFAEAFGTRYGLGYYIMDMWTRLNYRGMARGILATAALGLAGAVAVDVIEYYACRWRRK